MARGQGIFGGLFGRLTGEYFKLQKQSPEHGLYQRLAEYAIKQIEKLQKREPAELTFNLSGPA